MDSMPVTSAFYTRRFIKQIEEEIPTLIKLQREGTYWDFKQQWHSDRSELKADIICLANNIESSTSYLIFGISDKDFSPVDISDDENRKTQSDIIDMLKNMQWKGDQPPFILMHSMQYENSLLDIIAIKSRPEDMPYMLSKGDANIYANIILNRQGDRNSPKKQGASWREIEAIWRHHFSLGLSPLKQVQLMLRDKENWTLLERDEDDKFIEKCTTTSRQNTLSFSEKPTIDMVGNIIFLDRIVINKFGTTLRFFTIRPSYLPLPAQI